MMKKGMMHGPGVIKNCFHKEISCHHSAEFGALEMSMKDGCVREYSLGYSH